MITKSAQAAISAKSREAATFISSLRIGDAVVVVTLDGRELNMTVSRGPGRSDGAYGSWESTRVTVTLGVGRYSCEVIADAIGNGRMAIRRALPVSRPSVRF